jgi:Spy/CpxP family protein refolding chaperone
MTTGWIRAAAVAALISAPAGITTVTAQGIAARRNPLLAALRALGVTDAQKQQIRAVVRQNRGGLQPLMRQVAAARIALQEAVAAVPPNDGAISSASANLAAAQAQASEARGRIVAQIVQLLTPEQQQALQARIARRKNALQQR